MEKRSLYKTAIATIGCALFPAGEIVSVEWKGPNDNGTHWYLIAAAGSGPLPYPVLYPEHHLTSFVL